MKKLKLSKLQKNRISSIEDITNWPYPIPITYAGRGQFRRAKKLALISYNLTKDFTSRCHILSKKGKWIGMIYWNN